MKKYICYGGIVKSQYDGDEHYICATKLAKLYNVPLIECICINYGDDVGRKLRGIDTTKMTNLFPKKDGNYVLEKERCRK